MKKDTLAIAQDAADWLLRNVLSLDTERPPRGFKRIRLGTWTYEQAGKTIVVFKNPDPSFEAENGGDWYWSITAHVNGFLKEIDSGYGRSLNAACTAALLSLTQGQSLDHK